MKRFKQLLRLRDKIVLHKNFNSENTINLSDGRLEMYIEDKGFKFTLELLKRIYNGL